MDCTMCDRNTERIVNKASLLFPCEQCKSWDPVIGSMGAFNQTQARVRERWTGRWWDAWSVLLNPKMIGLPLPTRRPPSIPSWSTPQLILSSNSPCPCIWGVTHSSATPSFSPSFLMSYPAWHMFKQTDNAFLCFLWQDLSISTLLQCFQTSY